MTSAFELPGCTVRVPVPEGWEAAAVNGRVRVSRSGAGEEPPATVELAIRAAADLPTALDEEIAGCVAVLTDFTILHAEPRPTRAANWPGGAEAGLPFVLGGFRQGIFSVLMELGLVGADAANAAVVYSVCLTELAAAMQDDTEAIVEGIELEWS